MAAARGDTVAEGRKTRMSAIKWELKLTHWALQRDKSGLWVCCNRVYVHVRWGDGWAESRVQDSALKAIFFFVAGFFS